MRRTGLTVEQVRDPDAITFEYEQGLVFCRWRLKEALHGGVDLLATGLSLSVGSARLRAIEWLAENRRREAEPVPQRASDTESLTELLRRPDL